MNNKTIKYLKIVEDKDLWDRMFKYIQKHSQKTLTKNVGLKTQSYLYEAARGELALSIKVHAKLVAELEDKGF